MPKQPQGRTREIRFRLGVEFFDFLERIAETNRFGNSVGEVANRILQDAVIDYYHRSQEFRAEHEKIKPRES